MHSFLAVTCFTLYFSFLLIFLICISKISNWCLHKYLYFQLVVFLGQFYHPIFPEVSSVCVCSNGVSFSDTSLPWVFAVFYFVWANCSSFYYMFSFNFFWILLSAEQCACWFYIFAYFSGICARRQISEYVVFLIFFIHVFSVYWSCHILLSPTSLSFNHSLIYLLPPSKFHVFFSNLPSLIITAHIQMCGVSLWVWANHQWLSSPKTRGWIIQ